MIDSIIRMDGHKLNNVAAGSSMEVNIGNSFSEGTILSRIVVSSSARVKVVVIKNSSDILTVFVDAMNHCDIPDLNLFINDNGWSNGLKIRVFNLDHQSADIYVTTESRDCRAFMEREFTRALENELSR